MFSIIQSVLPQIYARYKICNLVFHLHDLWHSFAEQSIRYCLINLLNKTNGSTSTIIVQKGMVYTSSFSSYKYHITNEAINSYLCSL